ncbi:MAG: CoA transferase [Actinomycetia bacterium]|nr:CoA transferase [Actinomycetes bacterium]
MTWEQFEPDWSPGDVDAASVWAACGGQLLTDPEVAVPSGLVNGVAGVAAYLDRVGAGLSDRYGSHGLRVLTERAATRQLRASGRVSSRASVGGASRLVRCVDGWIAVSLPRPDDFAAVPAWLQTEACDWSAVETALASATVASTVERAGWLGIACAAVGERAAQGSGIQVESLGAASPKPVAELVVANLASLWAGPLAADVLARCGARVITVESTSRPDGARAWPVFFDDLHSRCDFVALDFADEVGRRQLAELLHSVDVVIEGSRPRALEQLGIDAREVTNQGPQLWVSITGHGRDEPHANRIGFGDDAAAAGGLVGWVNGEPRFLADAVADPITGLAAAAAVVQLAASGGRWLVDAPLAAVAASHAGMPASNS